MPETILEEAQRLVHGLRQQDYGHPLDNYTDIARVWSVILRIEVTAEQAALCMVGLKLARESFRPKRDNRTDMAGYTEVLDMIGDERERRAAIESIRIGASQIAEATPLRSFDDEHHES